MGSENKKAVSDNKKLLNVKELQEYTGWGESTIRKLLKKPDSTFTIRMGNRLYADKLLFDEYLRNCAKYQINVY